MRTKNEIKIPPFDYDACIKRNKEVAMNRFGDKLDADRNVKGTPYYYDRYWRLCKRGR